MKNAVEKHLNEIIVHLGAALVQSIETGDAITMGHVRNAYKVVTQLRAELEDDTLADLSPEGQVTKDKIMAGFDRAIESLKQA
jgi:hypothetical protein